MMWFAAGLLWMTYTSNMRITTRPMTRLPIGRQLGSVFGLMSILSGALACAAGGVEPAPTAKSQPASAPSAEELTKVKFILVARDQCELLEPGYRVRNSKVYESWRKSRIEAVQKVEADPEFRSQRTEMLNTVRKQLAAGAKTAEEQEDVEEFRVTCDSRLPEFMAKADDPPPVPQGVQSAPAVVVRHSVQHKSATQMGGSTAATPPSQP